MVDQEDRMSDDCTVVGYHGTSAEAAAQITAYGFGASARGWLGPGVYFHAHDSDQARGWAEMHHQPPPVVLCARLHLGEGGLDLLQRAHRSHYRSLAEEFLQGISPEKLKSILQEDEGFVDYVVLDALAVQGLFPWVRAATLLGRKDYQRAEDESRVDYPAKTADLSPPCRSRVIRNVNIQIVVHDLTCIGAVHGAQASGAEEDL